MHDKNKNQRYNTMSLIKRSNGIYYIQKQINKKRIRISLETRDRYEAQDLYNLWITEYRKAKIQGKDTIPTPLNKQLNQQSKNEIELNRPSLLSAYNQYLKVSELNINSKAHLKEKHKLKAFIISLNIEWCDITQNGIINLQERLKQALSLSYACKMITHFKSFMNFAIKQDYFYLHDFKKIEFMKSPKSKKRACIFSKDDIRDMLLYCQRKGDLDFMYYMMTLYLTGSRPSEIVNLNYQDIDFKNLRISIWMNKVQRHKTIALNKQFIDELMGLVRFNGLDNGCLFVGSIKNKEFYSKKFKSMRDELNLDSRYTLYLFRHTAGTKALEHSQNIHLVQEFLGHEDIRTTSKYYMLDNPERTRKLHDDLVNEIYDEDTKNKDDDNDNDNDKHTA